MTEAANVEPQASATPQPQTSPERVPQKATALTRERIIKAAYLIAKKDPLNAMSMRKIAGKLKVTPMAIYKHFSDKDELTAAVIDMLLEESELIPANIDPSDWRAWIKASFLRMHDVYEEAPGMVQYMSHATTFGPAVLTWQNEVLKVLITAGLAPAKALTAQAAMAELVTGSTILTQLRRLGMERIFPSIFHALQEGKAPTPEELQAGLASMVDHPWLLLCGAAMLEDMHDPRKALSKELDILLDGIEMQVNQHRQNQTSDGAIDLNKGK
ncbi:Transcriptional regulator [gamma proteobacterium HdN1]|nr:Transcriptional regulator [gamma proteobacterium HdN1]